jgi:hypothetical protein
MPYSEHADGIRRAMQRSERRYVEDTLTAYAKAAAEFAAYCRRLGPAVGLSIETATRTQRYTCEKESLN